MAVSHTLPHFMAPSEPLRSSENHKSTAASAFPGEDDPRKKLPTMSLSASMEYAIPKTKPTA